ncbi:MAG: pyridoxal phosphate-dependent aminotransferase, partial [Rhodobacteraceae bacterium]|nr:pyridoxal phosphate-dependent aminotransferase [Paracoccaceae bacterium]
DISTHPSILEAMHASAMGGHTGYALMSGTDSLRDAVAARVTERTGQPTSRDNVLITPGGQSALFASHHAALDVDDRAVFIDPHYTTYPGTIRALGGVPVPVQAYPEDGFQPRAADLARAADGARSMLINSPNNPTGALYTRDTLDGIAQVCRDKDLWLISDEVYDTQVWDGAHISPRTLPDMAERTLVVGSMSKSHAMTGSRCGWVVGPAEAIDNMVHLATNTTYGVPGYIQDAAVFALAQGESLEAEISTPFRRRRDIARRIIESQNIVTMIPSGGAMYVMLDLRATGMSGEDFANHLLDTHKIAVMPGESFGKAAAGHVRVAMTVADDAFATALETLCDTAATLAA